MRRPKIRLAFYQLDRLLPGLFVVAEPDEPFGQLKSEPAIQRIQLEARSNVGQSLKNDVNSA